MHLSPLIISLLLAGISSAKRFSKAKDAVLLSQIRSLTLRGDKITAHRRVDALQQLSCVGGNARGLYEVDVMRCTNSGSEYDAEDIQWTCQASLPPEFKLGSTDVVCEGYDGPDDPYILKSSCAVEYRLILTDKGEEKYKQHLHRNSKVRGSQHEGKANDGLTPLALFLIVIVIVALFIYCSRGNAPREITIPRINFGGGGGGGGGGGWGGDDPPPPYTPRAPPKPKSAPRASRTTPSGSSRSGPGFWSGAATGAAAGGAAGYYMGSRNREPEARPAPPGPSPRQGGSSWFGGGGEGSNRRPRSPPPAPASPPSAPSSSHYDSTGFGGTRRR